MPHYYTKPDPDNVNSLPNVKISDWSKLKQCADDKINVSENLKYVLERIQNIVGNRENAGDRHFLLFQQFFQKTYFSGSLKVGIVWEQVKHNIM